MKREAMYKSFGANEHHGGVLSRKIDASYVRNNRINVMQIHVLSARMRVTLSFIEFNQLASARDVDGAVEFETMIAEFICACNSLPESRLSKKLLSRLFGVSRLLSSRIASQKENFAVHRRERPSS